MPRGEIGPVAPFNVVVVADGGRRYSYPSLTDAVAVALWAELADASPLFWTCNHHRVERQRNDWYCDYRFEGMEIVDAVGRRWQPSMNTGLLGHSYRLPLEAVQND